VRRRCAGDFGEHRAGLHREKRCFQVFPDVLAQYKRRYARLVNRDSQTGMRRTISGRWCRMFSCAAIRIDRQDTNPAIKKKLLGIFHWWFVVEGSAFSAIQITNWENTGR
jgi:hypothetical protein